MSGIPGKTLGGVALFALAMLLCNSAGCAPEPYVSGYQYYPQPAVVDVKQRGANQVPMTVLVTIVGVRNADRDTHRPYAVEVRLRFENNGPASAVFDPGTLDLVTGALQPFPRPQVQPPVQLNLAPGQRAEATALFPLPPGATPGQMDLNNLRVRWQVRVNNYPVPQTALFQRVPGGDSGSYYEQAPSDATY